MTQITHYAALIDAIRARVAELGINYELIDEFAGLASGHFAKLVCDPPLKKMGSMTLFLVLGALGLRLALVDDPEARERTQARFKKRQKPHHMQLRASWHDKAGMTLQPDFLRLRAKKGGEARMAKLNYREARRLGRKGALARWAKANGATPAV